MNRLLSVALACLLPAFGTALAAPAGAATRTAVTITSPAEGATVQGPDLTVSGTVTRTTATVLTYTVTGDPNTYIAYIDRGTWSAPLAVPTAGTATVCAEIRGTGDVVIARDCNTFTVKADPAQLQLLYPEEGSVQADSVRVVATCYQGTVVQLALDDDPAESLPCDYGDVARTYDGLTDGDHTVTATMLDAGIAVATQTHTFTVEPGVVHITSPTDGSSGYGSVVVAGTASSPIRVVNVLVDGEAGGWQTSFDDTGAWSVDIGTLPVGTHTVCASVLDRNYTVDAEDCVTYTVTIDPALLTITTPEQGATNGPSLSITGGCAYDTTVRVSLDGGPSAEQPCTGSYEQSFPYPAPDGPHTVRVTMLYGDQEIASLERSFTVDSAAPAPPTITSPTTRKAITSPTLPLVGTSEPGSTVYVSTAWLGQYSAVAGNDGIWRLTLDSTFFESAGIVPGRRTPLTLSVAAEDSYGNRSTESSYTYTVQLR